MEPEREGRRIEIDATERWRRRESETTEAERVRDDG
ncbi:hypothetical protein A2U01_0085061, partial [Trifolium medium]|nr:hypothetical protein [Trifolium medium]